MNAAVLAKEFEQTRKNVAVTDVDHISACLECSRCVEGLVWVEKERRRGGRKNQEGMSFEAAKGIALAFVTKLILSHLNLENSTSSESCFRYWGAGD